MAELKTQKNDQSVEAFLEGLADDQKRQDCRQIMDLMGAVTGVEPSMWGDSIVGFGRYRYRYASGREGEWFLTGFAPRKRNITLYIMSGFDEYAGLLGALGKHSTGKSCLYIKRLEDIDLGVLKNLVARSVEHMAASQE